MEARRRRGGRGHGVGPEMGVGQDRHQRGSSASATYSSRAAASPHSSERQRVRLVRRVDVVVGQARSRRRSSGCPAAASSATIGIEPPERRNTGAAPHARSQRPGGELDGGLRRPRTARARRSCALARRSAPSGSAVAQQALEHAARSRPAPARARAARRPCACASAGTIVRGSPPTISLTSTRRVGAVALVVLGAGAAGAPGAPPTSAITSSPGGSRAHDSRSARRRRRDAGAQLLAHAPVRARAPRAASIACSTCSGVEHAAAVHARVQVARARCARVTSHITMPRSPTVIAGVSLVGHAASRRRSPRRRRARRRAARRPPTAPPASSSPSTSTRTLTGSVALAGQRAGDVQQRQEVALVVGGAARVEAPVADLGLERRRRPGGGGPRALDVVVAVDQHGGRVGVAGPQLADGQRVTAVHHHLLGLAAGRPDPVHHPLRRALQGRSVGIAGGDRGDRSHSSRSSRRAVTCIRLCI